jgi:hypothetical protein
MARGVKDMLTRKRMLELRLAGLGYREIARALGYSNPGFIHRVVQEELREVTAAPARELRELEQLRLDTLLRGAWPAAIQGDQKAILACLKIIELRARLLGLEIPRPEPDRFPAPPGAVLVLPGLPQHSAK